MSLPALDSDTSPAGYLPSVVTPTTARWTSTSFRHVGQQRRQLGPSGAVPNDVLTSGQVTTCASVLFDGLASPQHSITLSGSQAVTSLAFNLTPSTTSGFTFSGSTLTLGEAGLTNNDVHTQTFNNAIILRASQQWHAGTGGLTISASGSLNLGTSQLLYLDGSGTSDFEGVVSGGSSGIAKDGSGTLILGNANNSFSGTDLRPQRHAPVRLDPERGRRQQRPGRAGDRRPRHDLPGRHPGLRRQRKLLQSRDRRGRRPRRRRADTGVIDASGSGPLNLTRRRDLRELQQRL